MTYRSGSIIPIRANIPSAPSGNCGTPGGDWLGVTVKGSQSAVAEGKLMLFPLLVPVYVAIQTYLPERLVVVNVSDV